MSKDTTENYCVHLEWMGKLSGIDRWLQVAGHYDPGRPAPMCQNHDSPAFSDPGDPAELQIYTIEETYRCGNLRWLSASEIDELFEEEPFYDQVCSLVQDLHNEEPDND
jgi:hypothetical protein